MAKIVNTNATPRYADDTEGDHGGGTFKLRGGETVEVDKSDPLHDLLIAHPGVETDSKESREKIEQVEVMTAGHGPDAFPAEVAPRDSEADADAEPPEPGEDHTKLPSEIEGYHKPWESEESGEAGKAGSYSEMSATDLKALAKERGIKVTGSGKKGAVVKEDVVEALESDDGKNSGGSTGTLTSDQVPKGR